jgi:putative Mg2+ transporter-C (MgtC) family protein
VDLLPELGWDGALVRLVVAAALGGAIGLERELREREAGLRTHLLVTLGAALFTVVSAYAFRNFPYSRESGIVFDPTRITAQIVSGIGFLGAGAIIRQGLSVRGLTTAATLWVAAAIGIAAGAGYYSGAVLATAIVILVLWPLRLVAYRVVERFRPPDRRLVVDVGAGLLAGGVLRALESLGGRVEAFQTEHDGDARRLVVEVDLPAGVRPHAVRRLAELEGVHGVRWSR